MTTPNGPTSPLAYWPAIERAGMQGMTTAALWAEIRNAAAEYGFEKPGISLMQVNQLRAAATAIGRAAAGLAKAADDDNPLSFVGVPPYAAPLATRDTAPMYLVRFEQTIEVDGEQQTAWRSIRVTGSQMPATVADFGTFMDQETEAMADTYNGSSVGYSSVSILAV